MTEEITTQSATATLEVLDSRRRVWSLYAEVRRLSVQDPADGHRVWRAGRDDLLAHHPASPLLSETRETFTGLPVAPYDPAWRFELAITDAEPATIEMSTGSDGDVPFEMSTGSDGDVPFERIGRVGLPSGGSLDV